MERIQKRLSRLNLKSFSMRGKQGQNIEIKVKVHVKNSTRKNGANTKIVFECQVLSELYFCFTLNFVTDTACCFVGHFT